MQHVLHNKAILCHAAPDQALELTIRIGAVQDGEWWVWIDRDLLDKGTATEKSLALGAAAAYYGKLILVEVRCDDTNPHTDRLTSAITLAPTAPPVEWITSNSGQETQYGVMTSIAHIFVMPVAQ